VRRIPLSRRSHVTGFQVLPAGITEHESALERDFVTLATFTDSGAKITSQPVTIAFLDAGMARRYTPDFLVHWSSGHSELVEIKYRSDLKEHWKHLRPAFMAARDWCQEHERRFRIATERSIRCPRLANAKRLLPLRTAYLDPAAAWEVSRTVASLSEPTLARLAAAVPVERAVALGAIWRMIARGALRMDLTLPIAMDAPVALP
jgi:hypothetical protein